MHPSRRSLLRTGGLGLATGLAGCLGSFRSSSGGDGVTLQSLAVGGSPGGELAVRPSGRPTLVDFFATWCAPCKPQMSGLGEIRERYPDLAMRSVTSESDQDAVRRFWREYDGTWPVLLDPDLEATSAYSPPGLPTLYVVDADGEQVWEHTGLARTEAIADAVERARS
jgi:thiol-disulfide isomerase/thioredoxin